MGWLGDSVVLGQKPRDNGCICAYALIPIIGALLAAAGGAIWGIKTAVEVALG